ncbi:hypothetical protein DRE_03532 [Drechslerella stenobrocha 248]|uniref:Uncharacterized protein n=1 Tax=Drechslerella stenobrocha 248 TaxID=1043628 RepID=W7I4S7_9PEZI|nr:hypothetical protein DRE_03532 [Drechslerella stenobrocha 248]
MAPPSSRSASSRPSLSSTRSTPPTDEGESSSSKMPPLPKTEQAANEPPADDDEAIAAAAAAAGVALPSEEPARASESNPDDDAEIDAIFEDTASESGSPRRPPSIPDYHSSGPRNYSRLTIHDSDDDFDDGEGTSGTPPPNPFGPTIRSATLNTARQVAGEDGMVFPSAVCESPSPSAYSRRRVSSIGTNRGSKGSILPESSIFSPFSSAKRRRSSRNGFSKGLSSPSRKSVRAMEAPIAPSPDAPPLVLLHVTLLPLPAQGAASSVLANHLRRMISPTVVARGLLLPHPNDDYDALVAMVAENLGLDQETPPPFKRAPTSATDDGCASHSEGSYIASSGDEAQEPYCPTCSRRRLKPEDARHNKPRRVRQSRKQNDKWYSINIFASNGLMRAGAWSRSWEEMERVDVEVTVTPGYEDVEPIRLRPSSQRSEGRKTLQSSFQFKRRMPPTMVGVETTTDEEMPRPRRTSGGKRKTSGSRNLSGSIRSRNGSNYSKQEPLSELEILADSTDGKEIFEEELDTDIPIFEAPEAEDGGTFVPIWEDKDVKDAEEVKPAERMHSEDAWITDEESVQPESKEQTPALPSDIDELAPGDNSEEENRRLSAFTMDTAIHHNIASSSRGTSIDRDLMSPSENLSPEPEVLTPAISPPVGRKVSNPHRLHPSSRRSSIEIKPGELGYAPSEKTASRPSSSRVSHDMAIVGLAISDDSDLAPEDFEYDKENHHESQDNKENIPVEVSDDEEAAPQDPYPEDDEDPEELRSSSSPRMRRAVTPKTAGPSPMPSRFSSPAISPDISPIMSRANSPEPPKVATSKQRQRRASRRISNKSSETKGDTRKSSSPSLPEPTEQEDRYRGRSLSRSTRRSMTPSPSPIRREKVLEPETVLEKLQAMIKPTIDTLSSIPLPTLLLIAIPFAGLIAFSVNSYVQQRNLDYMVRNFMDTQIAQQMQILQQQQRVVHAVEPAKVDVPEVPEVLVVDEVPVVDEFPVVPEVPAVAVVADIPEDPIDADASEVPVANHGAEAAEKVLAAPVLTPEEQAELDWRNAQQKGLEHESVVYGIQVGGKCVMPEEVAQAIRIAALERDKTADKEDTGDDTEYFSDEADVSDNSDDEVEFGSIEPEIEAEPEELPKIPPSPPLNAPESPKLPAEAQPRYDTAPPSPRVPYRNTRERSRERKNVQQQPYDYYQQPPNIAEDVYDRLSDAGDINVGKRQVRDGGLEDTWYDDIPEMMLPPPLREVPASPSQAQDNVVEPSTETQQVEPSTSSEVDEAGVSPSPYQEPEQVSEAKVEAPTDVAATPAAEEKMPIAEGEGAAADVVDSPVQAPREKPSPPSRPASRRGGSPKQSPVSRPASRAGRAASRPPSAASSGSAPRSRPSSRSGSKARSKSPRAESSAAVQSPVISSTSTPAVQEGEKEVETGTVAAPEQPHETEPIEYQPLNLHLGKDIEGVKEVVVEKKETVVEEEEKGVPVAPVVQDSPSAPEPEKKESAESWTDRFFERLQKKINQRALGRDSTEGEVGEKVVPVEVGEKVVPVEVGAADEASKPADPAIMGRPLPATAGEGQSETVDAQEEVEGEAAEEELEHHIPDTLMEEEYVFEEGEVDEYEDVNADDVEVEGEEFDYEGFQGSLKEGWWEEERR